MNSTNKKYLKLKEKVFKDKEIIKVNKWVKMIVNRKEVKVLR